MNFWNRRQFLGVTAAAGATLPFAQYARAEEESLGEIAAKRGILFGAAARSSLLNDDDNYAELYARECAMIVALAQWDRVAPTPTREKFANVERDVQWARQRKIKYKGHALLWGKHVPAWFEEIEDRSEAEKAVRDHITSLCTHFKGKIHSWDVVNEAIKPKDGRPDGLDNTVLTKVIGPEHLDIAFQTAREADPKAILVYNDGSNTYDIPDQALRRKAFLGIIDRFKQNNVPIDAVGLHSHLFISYNDRFNEKVITDFLNEISSRGLKISITELDVADKGAPADREKRDAEVAALYKRYLDLVLDNPAVDSVVIWGLTDKDSWIIRGDMKEFVRDDDAVPRPLPFDNKYQPKPAYAAIKAALAAAPPRAA